MEKSIYAEEYRLFVAALREVRKSVGVTQIELASRLSVTQAFVSKCEGGQRRLDVIEVKNWCAALGITMSEFVASLEDVQRRTAIAGAKEG
ncbi:helix-turn-helix domain-containing protein [Ralstonia pickettii]|uniref:helix-turn-helix domain-containing protein n=1 Tax=Ralstonia pseudosolanacearum TaxID=1310165 RepID=UPI000BBD212E|nr:transcriptional regulator [Ralstonia pickettii]